MFGLEHGCAHTPTLCFCIGLLGLRYPAGRATEKTNKQTSKGIFSNSTPETAYKVIIYRGVVFSQQFCSYH